MVFPRFRSQFACAMAFGEYPYLWFFCHIFTARGIEKFDKPHAPHYSLHDESCHGYRLKEKSKTVGMHLSMT